MMLDFQSHQNGIARGAGWPSLIAGPGFMPTRPQRRSHDNQTTQAHPISLQQPRTVDGFQPTAGSQQEPIQAQRFLQLTPRITGCGGTIFNVKTRDYRIPVHAMVNCCPGCCHQDAILVSVDFTGAWRNW